MTSDVHLKLAELVKNCLGIVWALAIFAAVGVGVRIGADYWTGTHHPIWIGAVMGVCLGFGTVAMGYVRRRGWITIWPDRRELLRRRSELSEERERILRDARKN